MSCNKDDYKRLDINKLKKGKVISSEEALKDIEPIKWPDEVLNGEKKVVISTEGIKYVEK